MTLLEQGVWTRWVTVVPSSPTHSVIISRAVPNPGVPIPGARQAMLQKRDFIAGYSLALQEHPKMGCLCSVSWWNGIIPVYCVRLFVKSGNESGGDTLAGSTKVVRTLWYLHSVLKYTSFKCVFFPLHYFELWPQIVSNTEMNWRVIFSS